MQKNSVVNNNNAKTHETQEKPSKSENKKANRLLNEKSPYLQQHVYNPVDWYPWGEEAFAKAKEEDKPVFLSIGYSTCHWCHVMEHESFEDDEVAKLMNETFICIKVDREERPDIDNIYMLFCQVYTGSGGWPLTAIMTPDKKPFFAGTYFPKDTIGRRIGMTDLVPRIGQLWKNEREALLRDSQNLTKYVEEVIQQNPGDDLPPEVLAAAYEYFNQNFDKEKGGFSQGTKFPTPHNLMYLMRYAYSNPESKASDMVKKTLTEMRLGGIYDQVGFGFHRYSTDRDWLLPHFEKMLYDQALLAMTYLEAYQFYGDDLYRQTAEEIFTYCLRDMKSPLGGFYSAEDADSEGEEGKFYVWTEEELKTFLTPEEVDWVKDTFSFAAEGNFEEEASGHKTGANICYLKQNFSEMAKQSQMDLADFRKKYNRTREKLFLYRKKRIHPYKDDKILTDWNALFIAALAKGGRILGKENYTLAAIDAWKFIRQHLHDKNGLLLHRYRDGESAIPAYLDDYSFLVFALLEIYETTGETDYLKQAIQYQNKTQELFGDENGGFFFTSKEAEKLLFRQKKIYDGAIPAGNSVAMLNLLRLGEITGNKDFQQEAEKTGKIFIERCKEHPGGHSFFMMGLDFFHASVAEVSIVGNKKDKSTSAMLNAIHQEFLPHKVLVLKDPSDKEIESVAPFCKEHVMFENKATVYICQNYTCQLPLTDIEKVLENLR